VRLRIVDVTGRVVRTLVDQDQAGGSYRVTWEGKDNRGENASSGIYFSVLDARGTRQTRKLVLLK
jgi:flagellar hook assembly protein FlgD